MNSNFDIQETLKQSAIAYYRHEYNSATTLLKGCLRRLSLLPLNTEQRSYLEQAINNMNQTAERCDFTGLADIILFELIQNFPDFNTLFDGNNEQ